MNWLNEIALSEQAAAFRRTLGPAEFTRLQGAIENLAMVTQRPLAEVAERLLSSVKDTLDGNGPDAFFGLIEDIIEENER